MRSECPITQGETSDGTHPTDAGYVKMAKVWDDHLDAYFSKVTPIAAALNKPDLSPTPTAAKITLQSIGGAPFSLAIRHNNSAFDISGRAMHKGMIGVSKKQATSPITLRRTIKELSRYTY